MPFIWWCFGTKHTRATTGSPATVQDYASGRATSRYDKGVTTSSLQVQKGPERTPSSEAPHYGFKNQKAKQTGILNKKNPQYD